LLRAAPLREEGGLASGEGERRLKLSHLQLSHICHRRGGPVAAIRLQALLLGDCLGRRTRHVLVLEPGPNRLLLQLLPLQLLPLQLLPLQLLPLQLQQLLLLLLLRAEGRALLLQPSQPQQQLLALKLELRDARVRPGLRRASGERVRGPSAGGVGQKRLAWACSCRCSLATLDWCSSTARSACACCACLAARTSACTSRSA